MKQCAMCAKGIDHIEAPAILFIGRYGYRYELCPDCEAVTERFISPETEEDRTEAADILYHRIFSENQERKSAEMLEYIKSLFAENSETLAEAQRSMREYREESAAEESDAPELLEADEVSVPATFAEDSDITEEEFLAEKTPKTSLGVKLLFLFLFLFIGGGALAYGILRSSVFTIVVGALILLLGIASVFSRD